MNQKKKKLQKKQSKEDLEGQNAKEARSSHAFRKRLEKWQIGKKRFS